MSEVLPPKELKPSLEIACPCCQGRDVKQVASRLKCHYPQIPGEYSFVRCDKCGLHFQNPRLTDEELGSCYAFIQSLDDARIAGGSLMTPPPSLSLLRKLRSWWRYLQDPWPALPFIESDPVLDVGCNFGQFLEVLLQRKIAAEGLEFNPKAVAHCRQNGLKVKQGDINSADLPDDYYGTITLVHALEHFADPVAILKKLRSSLVPGGRIIIVVPYVRSFMRPIFGDSWHGWDAPFHLVHFDVSSMNQVCQRAGLHLIKTKLRISVEDFTRSLDLKQGTSRRRLFTRIMLTPLFKLAQWFGQGSYMIAVAERTKLEPSAPASS